MTDTAQMTDADARMRALDPERSFIVQAPAGSGKTELLIQRHLLLLSRVDNPEQVLAVTFTRKAAAEMRARVLEMLELAREPAAAVEPHRELSLALAQRVLERDREHDWDILGRPGRLRIETVDALNAWLAERLPIASGGMAGAGIIQDTAGAYRRAASRMLTAALTDDTLRDAARELLIAADNSFEGLVSATASILPLRDQWLDLTGNLDPARLRLALSRGMQRLVHEHLDRIRTHLGSGLCAELESIGQHRLSAVDAGPAEARAVIGTLTQDERSLCAELECWQAAAASLLTNSGTWRRRLTRAEGFGPENAVLKQQATDLIATLADIPDAARLLASLNALPAPAPTERQVRRVTAAFTLLRHAVAELKVIFQQTQSVDYLELALGAQAALGSLEAPSELLLAIDRRIEHVLVDEFQDTSHSQFHLLELLTAGWSGRDGRTLFLVGDPMQSIYRFRDADMSLFLRARTDGIGAVRLENLVLRKNFRSSPVIVDWVNRTFGELFPARDDASSGRAAYYAFEASRQEKSGDTVTLHRLNRRPLSEQQRRVVAIVDAVRSMHEAESLAILVQSRGHLKGLRAMLREAEIPVRAVELDALVEQPAIQDLLALTRALLHPADRIAWLAVLRAPWCGLGWADLHRLCGADPDSPMQTLIDADDALERMNGDLAAERLAFVRTRLREGQSLRGRYPFARWIECCWQLLDGPATLASQDALEQTRQFFAILQTLCTDGDLSDPAQLAAALDVPVSRSAGAPISDTSAVEIMTIHRAKGLEFDTVVLFGLDRRVRGSDRKMMYWQTDAGQEDSGWLAASLSATEDPLVRYLQACDRALDREERARVLYVAVTRARRRLHLIGVLEDGERPRRPDAGSLMSWLATRFDAVEVVADPVPIENDETTDTWLVAPLVALDPDANAPRGTIAPAESPAAVERTDYEWASPVAAHVGTVVHDVLRRAAAAEGPDGLSDALSRGSRYRRELRLLGVPELDLDEGTERVLTALKHVSEDDIGRWILAKHSEEASEFELSVNRFGRIEHLRIDRTFVDDAGTRWIIDYKTSRHSGGDVDAFLATEVDRYRTQMESYAAAMSLLDPRPIRVGLYFPLLNQFRDWLVPRKSV